MRAPRQNPPNNVVVESAPVKSVSQAATELTPFLSDRFFVGPLTMPSQAEVRAIAATHGFSSCPSYTIV